VRGGFCRIYPGQRIFGGDPGAQLSGTGAIFQRQEERFRCPRFSSVVNKDSDEVQLERSRTRESALRVTFGLNVRVKALRDVNASSME